MTGNTPTIEQIERHISTSFDSVNLILNKIQEPKTESVVNVINLNIDHLQQMLSYSWFAENLTETQYEDIRNCVISGNTYTF
jgi:hypothetical protein